MNPRYDQFNPECRFIRIDLIARVNLAQLAEKVAYSGNPEHKKNPGDFGLTPPSDPRQGKSLCDDAGIFSRNTAHDLLKQGLRKGLVSDRFTGDWPKNIWSVTENGVPLEAQLENPVMGTYHGYPMPDSDPLASEVLRRWREAHV
jgi:hypothetical protein